MRILLIVLIRVYWLIPKRNRKKCIFNESCSKHVYGITKQKGFKQGIIALKTRMLQCRKGYYYINNNQVRLADKTIVSSTCLNTKIL